MTIEQIVITILSFMSLSLLAVILYLQKLLQRTGAELLQSIVDKMEVLKKLGEEIDKTSALDHNEAFIKFLSQSREWAFGYIEDAQEKLIRFDAVFESAMSSKDPSKQLNKLKTAYKEIKTLLPSEDDTTE